MYGTTLSGKYVAEQSGPNNPGGEKGTLKVCESSAQSYDREAAMRLWRRSKTMTKVGWEALGESMQTAEW